MSDNDKSLRVPACIDCARRKTKCDRKAPCSSCMAAKIQCHYAPKRPERKRHVLHSSRYEESVDYISQQLEALSTTLQTLVDRQGVSNQDTSYNHASNFTPVNVYKPAELHYNKRDDRVPEQRDYEGESSFYSQSRKIADALGSAVSSASDGTTDARTTAVEIVQTLIRDAKVANPPTWEDGSTQLPSEAFSQYPELAGLNLPPMDSVLRLLALVRTSPQGYFMRFPFADVEEFAGLCQKLYFPTQPFSLSTWIRVNCGLYYLFRDLRNPQLELIQITKSQALDAMAACSNNIDQAIQCLRLCINPSVDTVDALISAATVNSEGAKGSLGWKLTSAAARMSIDLGLHRLPSGYGDPQRSRKRKLFWYVYSMDMSLAFNLGRSPTIQDYDVSTDRPTYPEDFGSQWGTTSLVYTDFVQTQADVYKQLFSAKAQQKPLQERVQRAHEFAEKLSRIKDNFVTMLNLQDSDLRDTSREAAISIEIGFYSVLTSLYRILPPENPIDADGRTASQRHPLRFHTLCVEAGRTALNALVYGWNITNDEDQEAAKIFMNWTLLRIPFMPYLAVFGNQIATGNQDDLMLLRNVVSIVESVAATSSPMSNMHRAFLRLLQIAELWKSANNGGEPREAQIQPGQSTTGLVQPSHFPTNDEILPSTSGIEVDMTAPSSTDFSSSNWQALEMSHQDWNMLFNEFDLGSWADSAREMIPWFEQHTQSFNTSG